MLSHMTTAEKIWLIFQSVEKRSILKPKGGKISEHFTVLIDIMRSFFVNSQSLSTPCDFLSEQASHSKAFLPFE